MSLELFRKKPTYIVISIIAAIIAVLYYVHEIFPHATSTKGMAWHVIILCLILAMMCFFLFFVLTEKKISYKKIFAVTVIGWGIIFQLVMPPLSGTDEWVHYMSSYELSNQILGTASGDSAILNMRKEDADSWEDIDCFFPHEYDLLANGNWFGVSAEDQEMVGVKTEYYGTWYRYIMPGLGITLARLLHLGFAGTVYVGRFMNTLLLLIIGLIALSILPVGKSQVVSIAMIPMILTQCNSYTYDALSNTLCILFVALCLHYSEENVKIRLIDVLILFFSIVMLLPNKGVYICYALLLFMIPWSKWKNLLTSTFKSKKMTIAAIVGAAAIVFIFVWRMWDHIAGIFRVLGRTNSEIEQGDNLQAFTFGYAAAHPWDTFLLWTRTVVRFAYFYIELLLGKRLGNVNLQIEVPSAYIDALFFLIIFSVLVAKGRKIEKKKFKIWNITAAVTLFAICIGCMVRFTPTSTEVLQLSGRYLLPIFTCGMIMAGTDEEENPRIMRIYFVQNLLLMGMASCILNYLLLR